MRLWCEVHQGREIEENRGKLNCWNGDSSRLHVRKSQYKCGTCCFSSWVTPNWIDIKLRMGLGFDWSLFVLYATPLKTSALVGPVLMTIGPWKPISIHTYDITITDIDVRSKVSERLSVNLTVDVSLSSQMPSFVSVVLRDPHGTQIAEKRNMKANLCHARAEFIFSTGSLDLWYPVGYGNQPIYTVEVNSTDKVYKWQQAWCFWLMNIFRCLTARECHR